jgi:hypothetical protein
MSNQTYGRRNRRQSPSIFDLKREIEERDRREREAASREWTRNRLMYSEEPADRIAVKAVAAGLISYASIEQVHTSHSFEHKKGWFGHTSDKETHTNFIKRTILER